MLIINDVSEPCKVELEIDFYVPISINFIGSRDVYEDVSYWFDESHLGVEIIFSMRTGKITHFCLEGLTHFENDESCYIPNNIELEDGIPCVKIEPYMKSVYPFFDDIKVKVFYKKNWFKLQFSQDEIVRVIKNDYVYFMLNIKNELCAIAINIVNDDEYNEIYSYCMEKDKSPKKPPIIL